MMILCFAYRHGLCWECLKRTLQPSPVIVHSSIRPCKGFMMHRYRHTPLTAVVPQSLQLYAQHMAMLSGCRLNNVSPAAQRCVCCFLFQNELSAATHLTSRLLKEYDKQVSYHGITLDIDLIKLCSFLYCFNASNIRLYRTT